MLVASVALVIWALVQVPSGQLFDLPAKVVEGGPKTWAALTGLVGF
jgi:NCS1 family nucleobase:cation symporter-1